MRHILFVALSAVAGMAFGQDYSTPYGAWRGQTQYQARVEAALEQSAHAVTPLVLEIEAAGRVRGVSTENGCRLLGVASPGLAPYMLNLDVTLSGCQYARFNRRYQGSLTLNSQGKHASFRLSTFEIMPGRRTFTADIKATMRR